MSTDRQVYYGDWEESGFLGMVRDFEGYSKEKTPEEQSKNARWQNMMVLFAAYTYEEYEGDALVLYKRDGKLYEVNAGHCSCYGLSESSYRADSPDQWEPEETTKEAILTRLNVNRPYGVLGQFKDEIKAALDCV
jgi:hypothetical protein